MVAFLETGDSFDTFSMLYLDEMGRFIEPFGEIGDAPRIVSENDLPRFFKLNVKNYFPLGVTDVFVWVHGWQNDEWRAFESARLLFANLDKWFRERGNKYSGLGAIVPAFVAVHWPSTSTPGPLGYRQIRNRAKLMTTEGTAEYFLASLLGYLDEGNARAPDRKVLLSREGYYVHCIGHSFGGRFLTAAIQAAATPTERARKVLSGACRETRYPFNVDSMCVLQMAAGASSFQKEFSVLLEKGPLRGPIVLTYSTADRALCGWHRVGELEAGIGCGGALAPEECIGWTVLRPPESAYAESDFSKEITNVDASHVFIKGGWTGGGHSDIWHQETLHLIASVVAQARIGRA